MDLQESPVTCCSYISDCPGDLIVSLYSSGSRGKKSGGWSSREWPVSGGQEWGKQATSHHELLVTGHLDGSVRFWDTTHTNMHHLTRLRYVRGKLMGQFSFNKDSHSYWSIVKTDSCLVISGLRSCLRRTRHQAQVTCWTMIHMLSPTLPSGWSMHSCYFILPSDLIGWIYRILDSYLNLPLIGYYLFVVLTPRCWQWQARLTKLSFTHLARRMALVKLPALRFPSSMKCPLTRMRTLPILTFLSGHLWGKVYCGATEISIWPYILWTLFSRKLFSLPITEKSDNLYILASPLRALLTMILEKGLHLRNTQ